jgi:Carbohydrate-selective porin, OprB family/S-layer homology domain
MKLCLWKLLLTAPIAAWATTDGSNAIANPQNAPVNQPLVTTQAMPGMERIPSASSSTEFVGTPNLPQLAPIGSQASPNVVPVPAMSQVTSVSQLTDVKPTEWAFQALQSLVERYGCIVGYPDKTYRGNRAMTRYEFAAGLNACLDKVQELIAAATADFVKKEDLETVKRLQEEFAAELATLRGRVAALEVRTATLEKQQFSATTRLNADVWMHTVGASAGDGILAERSPTAPANPNAPPTRVNGVPTRVLRSSPEITASYYTFLTLTSSFTGQDALVMQLVSGNGSSPANSLVSAGFFNSWGTPFLDQTGVITPGTLAVRELSYTFPIGNQLRIAVGPRLNYYKYFDGNRFTFFLNGATSYNSNGSTLLNAIDRGSGAVAIFTLNPQFKLTAAYMAENVEFLNPALGFNTSSDPANGLFKNSNTISAQLDYTPSRSFTLRLIYARTNLRAYNGFLGGAVGEPLPYGYADDGFGGRLNDSFADAFSANFDWLITRGFGVFGRYSYGVTDINPKNDTRSGGKVKTQSFQVGLGFPDLGKKGALGVLSFVMPHDFLEGRRFLLSGNGDGGTQYELEASYYYPLSDNIALVPALYAIFNPNNFDANPTVFVGSLRAQFRF